ncbi:MAG: thiol:disulfide interchange protein DsbA/DsbL [Proteobacteria bacterium]|nr:thiol:disulfide interchange protein DsbA/DsbL [Pseudomonadota bacterium]
MHGFLNRIAAVALVAMLPVVGALPAHSAPAGANSTAAAPVEGVDYYLIDSPDPIRGGKVEVVEVFGYGCPICARFQPYLSAWEKTLPTDVRFSYLPAAFGPDPEHCWDDFARAFYAAQAMGIQTRSHDAIYKAKFEQGRIETCAAIPSAYADYGPDPQVFASTMQSFPVNVKVTQAHDQAMRWGVDGTPTIVVDGAYRVGLTRSGGPEGMLRTVDWLIAKQRPLHSGRRGKR